jgi:hypothetical protein
MDDEELYVPDDVLEEVSTKCCLQNQNYDTKKNWKNLHNGRPRNKNR